MKRAEREILFFPAASSQGVTIVVNRNEDHFMRGERRVLVVEGNPSELGKVRDWLAEAGYSVFTARDVDHAISYLSDSIHVVLFNPDLALPGGTSILRLWKTHSPRTRMIVLNGPGDIHHVVEAIKSGCDDYLAGPVDPERLLLVVGNAISAMEIGGTANGKNEDSMFSFHRIVGQSPLMKEVFARVSRAAAVDSTVMVLGENGTGKELVAQALHEGSPRRSAPFVAMNVAAVPATLVESELFGHVRGAFTGATDRRIGRFEQAHGGTLFIDEIADFDLALQPKLLRVLETLTVTPVGGHEERKVDPRVIAATSRNIQQMVQEGTFRRDLYYRLNVIEISLPPLRQRIDDIPLLIGHFIHEISQRRRIHPCGISPGLMARLVAFDWPGNVRQLHNMLERMMVLTSGEELTEADLPEQFELTVQAESPLAPISTAGLTMGELERVAISRALAECGNNRTQAAHRLGLSVRTLQRKLHLYEVEKREDAMEEGE